MRVGHHRVHSAALGSSGRLQGSNPKIVIYSLLGEDGMSGEDWDATLKRNGIPTEAERRSKRCKKNGITSST